MADQSVTICIWPRLQGLGGPASFASRLTAGLKARGVNVINDPTAKADTMLVIGGTARLDLVWRAKKRGVRIAQRLNGMNWVHKKKNFGLKYTIRAQYSNWILATIRRSLADRMIYQSQFSRTWWQTTYGSAPDSGVVIYNGVDLQQFNPAGEQSLPQHFNRILLVEGRLGGGMEMGLENAVHLIQNLARGEPNQEWELMVAGEVPEEIKRRWEIQAAPARINWAGVVKRDDIPKLDRSAHLLFSADLNAACPNSVIEALACGLPVIAYATGSLPELLADSAGLVVPYGANYWALERPDPNPLAEAARTVLRNQAEFRSAARKRAEAVFNIDDIVDQYLKVLVD